MGESVDTFFQVIEKETNAGQRLPNWQGELYLEVCLFAGCRV